MVTKVVEIITFGYLHGQPPQADVTFDVRRFLRDPAAIAGLLDKDGTDPDVQNAVMRTDGAPETLDSILHFASGFPFHKGHKLIAAVGCAGGKHRAATLGEETTTRLRQLGYIVTLTHRDAHRDRVVRATDNV